jgi:hypothetical protein
LLHAEQKVHDELVLALQYDGTGGEDSASDVLGNEGTDVGVSDFLAVWAVIRGLWAGGV